jgi:hypothetical protein
MTPDEHINYYTRAIKKMLLGKQKGYKTVGATAGGALGAGIGGTAGLVSSANKHLEGELDDLDAVDKLKEYLKSMGRGAGIGLGVGALAGAGAGELGRRATIRKPMQTFRNDLKSIAQEVPKNVGPAGEFMLNEMDRATPKINLTDSVKKKIMYMLSKKGPPLNTVKHDGVRVVPRDAQMYKAPGEITDKTKKNSKYKN